MLLAWDLISTRNLSPLLLDEIQDRYLCDENPATAKGGGTNKKAQLIPRLDKSNFTYGCK